MIFIPKSGLSTWPYRPPVELSLNLIRGSMDIVVQPAVSWMDLNEDIKASGLFFPVDPGPSVCIAFFGTSYSLADLANLYGNPE